ncbi:hypothetical protein MRB53_003908 [Persea americana]|uniref:Uncharacterized protein n=1 Tax=Persea americana TaxID=3435 RepID=A0ACC2MZJ0_PERAE|nr:hypothetical protein MRB53_003908 [Persea americana]
MGSAIATGHCHCSSLSSHISLRKPKKTKGRASTRNPHCYPTMKPFSLLSPSLVDPPSELEPPESSPLSAAVSLF